MYSTVLPVAIAYSISERVLPQSVITLYFPTISYAIVPHDTVNRFFKSAGNDEVLSQILHNLVPVAAVEHDLVVAARCV